jgi:hypothetical protein
MTADALLGRLDRDRRVGDGRWVARCPAHEDRSPSLSIRELNDGRVLVHDFGGCSTEAVLGALGLRLENLVPPKLTADRMPRERRPWLPADAFEIARREIAVVAIAAADMHKNRTLTDAAYERLFTAAERLDGIAKEAYGRG